MSAVLSTPVPARAPAVASPWHRAGRKLLQRRPAMVGLVIVALFVAMALLAPWIAPFDPVATS